MLRGRGTTLSRASRQVASSYTAIALTAPPNVPTLLILWGTGHLRARQKVAGLGAVGPAVGAPAPAAATGRGRNPASQRQIRVQSLATSARPRIVYTLRVECTKGLLLLSSLSGQLGLTPTPTLSITPTPTPNIRARCRSPLPRWLSWTAVDVSIVNGSKGKKGRDMVAVAPTYQFNSRLPGMYCSCKAAEKAAAWV